MRSVAGSVTRLKASRAVVAWEFFGPVIRNAKNQNTRAELTVWSARSTGLPGVLAVRQGMKGIYGRDRSADWISVAAPVGPYWPTTPGTFHRIR